MQQNRYFIALDTPGTPRPMRSRPSHALFLALAALAGAPQAAAWGDSAHRVVAGLAQAQLRPAAVAEVARLLAGEPDPSLAGISTWADDFKKQGGAEARRSSRWHYVDFAGGPGCSFEPARDCPNGDCVVAAINREFLRLADRKRPDAERAQALKYLVHFVADVHQPLHASPMTDKGGLDFQVSLDGKGDNLHMLWDLRLPERAIAQAGGDESAYVRTLLARPPLPPDPTRQSDRPAVDWAQESCRLVRDGGIYPPAHEVGDDYLDAHRAQLDERLRLAGSRLADMLNFALDPRQTR